MDEIFRLLRVINVNSCKSAVIISNSKTNKEGQLIDAIINREVSSDNEAAQVLYNATPNDVRYKMLKYRVKKKLLNHLLLLDFSNDDLSELEFKEQECLRLILQSKVLFRKSEFDLAHNLSSKAFKISNEYEFTDLSLLALSLSETCLAELNNKREYTYIVKLYTEFEIKEQINIRSQKLFNQSKMNLTRSVKLRKQHLDSLPAIIENLKENWQTAHTFVTFNFYYKLFIWYNELIGNFSEIINITQSATKLLEDGLVNPRRFNIRYNYYVLVYSYLRNRNYQKGLEVAIQHKDQFKAGSLNWFAFMENYFLLSVHAKHYDLGLIVLNEVTSNISFSSIFKSSRERWQIYSEYLSLFSFDGNFRTKQVNPYLLSLPEYSKDKQGFNVAILILQFIYYLEKKENEALLYRIESLKKYILTHLKDTFSLRSKTFLKLLILIVTEDYDVVACRKKGQKLYQKLLETPTPGDAYAEIEIVPYEHLWEHILDTLQIHYK